MPPTITVGALEARVNAMKEQMITEHKETRETLEKIFSKLDIISDGISSIKTRADLAHTPESCSLRERIARLEREAAELRLAHEFLRNESVGLKLSVARISTIASIAGAAVALLIRWMLDKIHWR